MTDPATVVFLGLWHRFRQKSNYTYKEALQHVVFRYWRWQVWEEVAARRLLERAAGHVVNTSFPWRPVIANIPLYKGRHFSYVFQGILSLSLSCRYIRAECCRNLLTFWRQMRAAVRNNNNALYLDGLPFLKLVKLFSFAMKVQANTFSSSRRSLTSSHPFRASREQD